MRTIVTAAMQRQYSQTELIFWITLVQSKVTASLLTRRLWSNPGLLQEDVLVNEVEITAGSSSLFGF